MLKKAQKNYKLIGRVISAKYDPHNNRTIVVLRTPAGTTIQKIFTGKHMIAGALLYYDPLEKAYRISSQSKKKTTDDMKNVKRTLVGRVVGDTTVHNFEFRADNQVHELDFVITAAGKHLVLAQVTEIRQTATMAMYAKCRVLAHLTKEGQIIFPNIPVTPSSPVYKAVERDLSRFFETNRGLYIGHLFGTRIPVHIDLKKLIIGGTALFGVRRTGKSYLAGVIVEELVEHGFPVFIIDPHGEYIFKKPNQSEEEKKLFPIYGISPKAFDKQNLVVALDDSVPADKYIDVDELREEDFYIRNIKAGRIITLVMKGLDPERSAEAVMVSSAMAFELRKKRRVPPYFFLIDEVHNFAPQKTTGAPKAVKYSKRILGHIASEGGKFGIGFLAISQRPAWVDKSVIAPLQNFFVTRIAWKNDKEVVKQSVVGADEYMPVIERLPVGKVYISGVTPFPALVSVRVRKSHHFGASVDVDKIMYELEEVVA